jgi:hypothetical protein
MTAPGGCATPVARFFFGRGGYVTRRAVELACLVSPDDCSNGTHGDPGTARFKAAPRGWGSAGRSTWTRPLIREGQDHRHGLAGNGVCKTPWTIPFKNLGMPAEARRPFLFPAATGLGGNPTLRLTVKGSALRGPCKRIGQSAETAGTALRLMRSWLQFLRPYRSK